MSTWFGATLAYAGPETDDPSALMAPQHNLSGQPSTVDGLPVEIPRSTLWNSTVTNLEVHATIMLLALQTKLRQGKTFWKVTMCRPIVSCIPDHFSGVSVA